MDFKSFIAEEEQSKHIVFAYMRGNPPTSGHGLVAHKVRDTALEHKADHVVVMSHSHEPKKNPLPPAVKVKHARRMFPGVNIEHSSKETPTFMHYLDKFHKAGYKKVTMVAGSDRVDEYKERVEKYKHPGMDVEVLSAIETPMPRVPPVYLEPSNGSMPPITILNLLKKVYHIMYPMNTLKNFFMI